MIRSRLALVAFLCAAAPAWAAGAGEPIFPPGSRVGLVPPADMTLARGLTGFRNAQTGAAILVVEMPADAYPGLAVGFTDEGLAAQGFALQERSSPEIGTGKAVLVTGTQAASGRQIPKAVLLASDPSTTALVIGQLPEGASAADQASVAAAIRTVTFRPALTLDEQLGSLPFRLRDTAGFRPVRALAGNSLLLTDGPADVVKEAAQPVLIVAESFTPPPPASLREAFARQALLANTFIKDPVLERSQSFRQGGSEWHEIVAKAVEATWGTPVTVMQTIRFEPDSYVRAVGIVRTEQRDAILPRFRQIVDSIVPR